MLSVCDRGSLIAHPRIARFLVFVFEVDRRVAGRLPLARSVSGMKLQACGRVIFSH